MAFIDTRGMFGPAGQSYSDARYNNQNDYDVWTDPSVTGINQGINPRTGTPWNRGDAEFGDYTAMAQAKGQAEADRQAAEDDDGFGGLMQLAMLAAAIYSGGAALGAWGGAGAAGAGALGGAEALALGDAMAGLIPAAELGAWTGAGAGALGGVAADVGAGAVESALPEALGEAGGYDFVSSEAAGALEQLGGGSLVDTAGAGALEGLEVGGEGVGAGGESAGVQPTEFVNSTNTAPYTPDYGTLADAQAAIDVGASDLSSMGIGAEVGGSIPAMDTLGSTSWLESAINSLKAGDTSWLSPNVSPSQLKSVVSSVLGGGAATTPAKTTKPAATNAGAFSGMYPVAQGKSALEAMMSGEDGNNLDEFMRLMAQSGKGA